MSFLALLRLLLFASATLAWSSQACAQHEHEHSSSEFDIFLSAEALRASDHVQRGDDDPWFAADVVFALTKHQFRIFGEYFVSAEEHDLERFQVGYEFVPETTLWLGRFHQPGSAWNTEHHHGRYLQTAITRPSIEFWEDQHGLIPQHITGALLESRIAVGQEAAIQFSSGIGAGPALTPDGYEPIDLVDNNPGHHRLSITARLAYLPEYVGATSAGFLFGHHELDVRDPKVAQALIAGRANLDVFGAYADWNRDPWRLIAAAYYVRFDPAQASMRESFIAGYAQIEHQLAFRLTAFGRTENSARMRQSRFVAMFDDQDGDFDITVRRNAAGLRWDFARRQALSIELSRVDALTYRANEIRAQWSAAVP